jgi:predicted nuclease of predicted toxin-antitoxin system
MNFLIDANLPRRLVSLFTERGHYAIHTLDLPDGNATVDSAVLKVADEKKCVVATKDSDFTTSFWIKNKPEKLLLISTGNIKNKELEEVLISNFEQIISDLSTNRFVEVTREHVIVHV